MKIYKLTSKKYILGRFSTFQKAFKAAQEMSFDRLLYAVRDGNNGDYMSCDCGLNDPDCILCIKFPVSFFVKKMHEFISKTNSNAKDWKEKDNFEELFVDEEIID